MIGTTIGMQTVPEWAWGHRFYEPTLSMGSPTTTSNPRIQLAKVEVVLTQGQRYSWPGGRTADYVAIRLGFDSIIEATNLLDEAREAWARGDNKALRDMFGKREVLGQDVVVEAWRQ